MTKAGQRRSRKEKRRDESEHAMVMAKELAAKQRRESESEQAW